jgi:D-alanyl-D-alanine carboxypeptidase/D-alanyl-D-alanine-endopeptidase (penicillin-binding protein 4)
MKFLISLLLRLSLVIFPFNAMAVDVPEGAVLSALVVDLDSDDVVYEHQPKAMLLPASNQKLITLYSALKLLDVNEPFRTSVYVDKPADKNGVVQGNIYFKFSGDPELSATKLQNLVEALKASGVKKVTKDVIIDDAEFDDEYFGQGWSIDQTKFCFSAPISAMNIDRNCFVVGIKKKKNGFDLMHGSYPNFAKIVNKAKDIQSSQQLCDFELKAYANNTYVLDGCYQKNSLPDSLKIAVQNPRINGLELIEYLLRSKKIAFRSINVGKVESKAKEAVFVESRPIHELLKTMSKDSDNLTSESIFKRISAKNTQYAGGWKNSSKLVKDLLMKDLDLEADDLVVMDGSGASRKNLISSEVFVKLLKNVYHDKKLKNKFIQCLPVSGKDGTMVNRFRYGDLANEVYAKTGSMDNVSSLSGYALLSTGKNYAFSIILNNSTLDYSKMKGFEEQLLTNILTGSW